MTISRITESASISTWNILQNLGFQEDWSVISEHGAGLTFNFGNFDLSASRLLNRWLVESVQFQGIMKSPRQLADVQFEIHSYVDSFEQCLALIVWNLDKYADGHLFEPFNGTAWIEEGRKHFYLLPWEQSRLAYEARPLCKVGREWLKLGFKALTDNAKKAGTEDHVEIDFDGKILSFKVNQEEIVMTAEGLPWQSRFHFPLSSLKSLPKHIMQSEVTLSIWEDKFYVGNWSYSGIVEKKE